MISCAITRDEADNKLCQPSVRSKFREPPVVIEDNAPSHTAGIAKAERAGS